MRNHLLKSIFISLILLLGVGNAWATYYYRGNQNSWGATPMTASADGFYEYFAAKSHANNGNQNQMFKVSTSSTSWNYNNNYMKSGFNGTNITNMGSWDGDNICMYHDKDYYILVYKPNTTVNNTSKPIVCAATYLPDNRECTVYFVNKDSWSKVNAYGWYHQKSTDGSNNGWPGKAMENTGKTYKGKQIWSYTYPQTYDKAIFNNNSSKTSDLTLGTTNKGKMYDYPNSQWIAYNYDVKVTFNANGHSTAPEAQTVLNGNKITEPTAPSEDGYTFGGWYKEAECTNKWDFGTDVLNDDITLYAKWTEITHTVTFANDGNGTTNPTGEIEVGVLTGIAIDATPNTDYEFKVWESSNGGTFATTADVANNTFYPTENTTLTATFRSTAVNALLVVAGENITSVTGSAEPIILGESYEIKATPAHGYKFNLWTAEPAENAAFDNASSATTQVKVQNSSVTVTASATEIMSALTTSNTYDEGTPSIDAPTTSVSEIGITTTATITAATDIDYTLASWTLENCVRTDGGADNATTITVKSNGNGAAATVTANYNIIPKITLYFVNSLNWATVKCHHWKDGGSTTTWPGDPMEVVSTVHGFDIYKVKFAELEHDQCIFNNNNNGKQTGNLAVQDGKYYYPETDEWYAAVAEIPTPCTDCSDYAIAGSMNDWSARRNRLKVTSNNDIVELTLELTAGDYEFKVAGPKGWFGNSGKYERKDSGNAWTYRIKDDENNDEDNARIYIDMTGEYTFTWQISTKKLTITYPELPDFSQQTDIILFRPSTNWKKDGAHFAAYFFGATAENWVNMTDADGDGIYEAANPKTNLSVKICRLKSGKTETKWENVKWRSINYEIPTGVENCWVVNDEAEDDATGIWTVLIGEGDNSTTLLAANGQTASTLVNRQFTTGNLYTISLPFTLENVDDVFGNVAYEYTSLAKNVDDVVLYFSKVNTIEAGKPYLIEPTKDVPGFIVEDVTLTSTLQPITFSEGGTGVTMEPVVSVGASATTAGKYWLAADRYLYNNENTLKSLRALFTISSAGGIAPRVRVALDENGETALDNITTGETTVKAIINGQLIIIRDGEMYNAQGVRL